MSSRNISIFRLAYALLNRAKLGQKLFCPPCEADRDIQIYLFRHKNANRKNILNN